MSGNRLTGEIIGASIEVHRMLGPGLLESVYEECLAHELALRHVPFRRQCFLPIQYKGLTRDHAYRIDLLVRDEVVVEIKAGDGIDPIHEAQLLTYMKLGGWSLGLLINFNVVILKNGIRRLILGRPSP